MQGGAQAADRRSGDVLDSFSSMSHVSVPFAVRAVALGADSREHLAGALARIRREWCSVQIVMATSHSDKSEGSAADVAILTAARAHYIYDFLRALGVHDSLMAFDLKGSSQPLNPPPNQSNARVEIEFVGWPCRASQVSTHDVLGKAAKVIQPVRPWRDALK
jgi:hypothetical protein